MWEEGKEKIVCPWHAWKYVLLAFYYADFTPV